MTNKSNPLLTPKLSDVDPDIYQIIQKENERQENGLELIASENYTSKAVMEAQGSVLTNKYAEGLPKKRYYGGCEFVDESETLAIERVKKLFGAQYANVQPHSGAQANMAVFFAALNPGDKILGMDLGQGGHLTHGSPVNISGKWFEVQAYGLDNETERIDYDKLEDTAKKVKPKLIIGGASAYPRKIDFEKMGQIAQSVGAYFMVDMAHIAGLVATGLHPTPIPHADFVTSTTHKTLRGPRGGIILTNTEEWSKSVNKSVFPGIQGGPLEHVIAAKAVAFKEALSPDFKTYQQQIIDNAQTLAKTLQDQGFDLVSGGTDNHLVLAKTHSFGLTGKETEKLLEEVGITCNKNMIPNDQRSPFVTSGIRLGTPALTARGMKDAEMKLVGNWIIKILSNPQDNNIKQTVKNEVLELCKAFPVYS